MPTLTKLLFSVNYPLVLIPWKRNLRGLGKDSAVLQCSKTGQAKEEPKHIKRALLVLEPNASLGEELRRGPKKKPEVKRDSESDGRTVLVCCSLLALHTNGGLLNLKAAGAGRGLEGDL
nr:hypothetical protein Iba_chr12dCG13410 [Ipomoea batatas]